MSFLEKQKANFSFSLGMYALSAFDFHQIRFCLNLESPCLDYDYDDKLNKFDYQTRYSRSN